MTMMMRRRRIVMMMIMMIMVLKMMRVMMSALPYRGIQGDRKLQGLRWFRPCRDLPVKQQSNDVR